MLANYGAEVFKIESHAGGLDAFRSYGDSPEASPRFIEVNLNTRSLTLNLKQPEGVALLKELVARSRRRHGQLPPWGDGAPRARPRRARRAAAAT